MGIITLQNEDRVLFWVGFICGIVVSILFYGLCLFLKAKLSS
jgi:hypothetical protein